MIHTKRTAPTWWIVSTYFISSSFLALIGIMVWIFGIAPYVLPQGFDVVRLGYIWSTGMVFLSALYGAKVVNYRYLIPNPQHILYWTMVVYVVFTIINITFLLATPVETSNWHVLEQVLVVNIETFVFYFASRHFLHKS